MTKNTKNKSTGMVYPSNDGLNMLNKISLSNTDFNIAFFFITIYMDKSSNLYIFSWEFLWQRVC